MPKIKNWVKPDKYDDLFWENTRTGVRLAINEDGAPYYIIVQYPNKEYDDVLYQDDKIMSFAIIKKLASQFMRNNT